MKSKLFEDMNVYEMQEYFTKYRSSHDTGYIQFLEEHLEIAEEKISILTKKLKKEKGES